MSWRTVLDWLRGRTSHVAISLREMCQFWTTTAEAHHAERDGYVTRRRLTLEAFEPRWTPATLTVGAGGAFSSVQSAVDAARPGDVVLLEAATFAESVNLSRMGSAVGGSPGNLTLRGAGAASVLQSPGGPALTSSAPFAGQLAIEQLRFDAPGSSAADRGIDLAGFSGRLTIRESVFEEIGSDGVRLASFSGDLEIDDNDFLGVGDGTGDRGLVVEGLAGTARITRNRFADVTDTALVLANAGTEVSTWLVDENEIRGEPQFFSTTRTALRATFGGDSRTEFVLDRGTIENMAAEATTFDVLGRAEARLRLSQTNISWVRGAAGIRATLAGESRTSLALFDGAFAEHLGDGLVIETRDAAALDAALHFNLFVSVGNEAGDEALVLRSAANATGPVRAFLSTNDFLTIADRGVYLNAAGSGPFDVAAKDNFFSENNGLAGAAAFVAEQSGAGSFRLHLDGNRELEPRAASYSLVRTGTGPLALEATAVDVTAEIQATNDARQVLTSGTIGRLPLGTIGPTLPLLVGGIAWNDADDDGLRESGENGLPVDSVTLSGATSTGEPVSLRTPTDRRGQFAFVVRPGQYLAGVSLLPGQGLSPANQAADDAIDSDFDPATRTAAVTLAPLTILRTLGAGISQNDPDLDGVPSSVENAGPNGGDANRDGTPDAQQSHVATFRAVTGQPTDRFVTLVAPAAQRLENVAAAAIASLPAPPAGLEFDSGVVTFAVAGLSAGDTTTVTWLEDGSVADTVFQYGRTGSSAERWYSFALVNGVGATLAPAPTTLVLRDGFRGDGDRAANGRVVFQGGPARDERSAPWQNPAVPLVATAIFDVNDDGVIAPLDALLLINELNTRGARLLPAVAAGTAPPPYLDVTGDNHLTPLDALRVINELNTNGARSIYPSAAAAPSAEGEPFDVTGGIALRLRRHLKLR